MTARDGSAGKALQENCKGLLSLLVDERSLVGCSTLGWMEYLCSTAVRIDPSVHWGGLPVVVFFGDDVQLPPVCDRPVYNVGNTTDQASIHGALIWKEFKEAVILRKIVRQRSDQQEFKNVLNSLRMYKTTSEQAQWLQKFQWDDLRVTKGENLLNRMSDEGLFVFPTHADEWNHNKRQLEKANKEVPIARVKAVSTGPHSSLPADKAQGLECVLYLCKGAKVMLTSNLNVSYGLFNGSVGKVVDIIYTQGKTPASDLPDVVMAEFPTYSGPSFYESTKIVPIVPIERRLDCPCHG